MAETSNNQTVPVPANTLETAGPVQESTTTVESANTPVGTASSTALPDMTDSAAVSLPPAGPVEAPTPVRDATPKSKPARRGGSKHHTKLKVCRRELVGIQAEIDSIHATIAALAVEAKQPKPELLAQLAALQARKAENALAADAAFQEYEAARKAASERQQRLASRTATASSTIMPTTPDLGCASPASSVSVTIITAPAVPLPPKTQTQIPPEVAAKPSSTAFFDKTPSVSAHIIRAPVWARLPSKKSAAIPIRAPGSAPVAVSPTPSYEETKDDGQDGSCWSDATRCSIPPTSSFAPALTWTTDFIPKAPSETSKKSDAPSAKSFRSEKSSNSTKSSKSSNTSNTSRSSSKSTQQTAPKAKTPATSASATPTTAAVIPAKSTARTNVKKSSGKTTVPAPTTGKATRASTKSSPATTSTPASAMPTATKKTRSVTAKASIPTHGQTTPSKTNTPAASNASANDKATDPSLTCPRCLSSLSKSPKDDYFSRSLQEKYLPVSCTSSDPEPMQTGGESEHLFESVYPAGISPSLASIAVVNLPIPPLEVSTMPPTDTCLFDDESTTPVVMIRLPGGPPSKPAGAPAVSVSLTNAVKTVSTTSTSAAKRPKRVRRSKKRKQAAATATAADVDAAADVFDAGSAHSVLIAEASGDIVIDCEPPVLESDICVPHTKAASTSTPSKPSTSKSRRAALRQRKRAAAAAQAEVALAATVSLPESAVSSPIISPLKPVEAVPDIALGIALPESVVSSPILSASTPIASLALTVPLPASAVASPVLAPTEPAEPVPILKTASDQTIQVANPAAAAAAVPLPESPALSPVTASSKPAIPLLELIRSVPTPPRASRIPGAPQRTRSASMSTDAPIVRGSSPVSRTALSASKSYVSLATARSPPMSHAVLPAKKSLRSPSTNSIRPKTVCSSRPDSAASIRPPSRSSSRSASRSSSRSSPKPPTPATMTRSVSVTSMARPTLARPRAASRVSSLETAGIHLSNLKPALSAGAPSRIPVPPMSRPNPGTSSFNLGASSFAPGTCPPTALLTNPYANYGSRGYDDDYSYGTR